MTAMKLMSKEPHEYLRGKVIRLDKGKLVAVSKLFREDPNFPKFPISERQAWYEIRTAQDSVGIYR